LLLLNLRRETRSTEPRLAEWLANLKDTISLTQLSLGNLSTQDALQAVRSLTANSLNQEQFGEWLYDETQGQPFYMKVLLDLLIERGLLIPHFVEGKGWVFDPQTAILDKSQSNGVLPAQLYELIQRRLARLTSPARQLLVAGAALRHDFTFDELSQVAQLPLEEGLVALDETIEHLFLRESNEQPERVSSVTYQFCHDKMREVIYLETSDARWHVLSGRALQAGHGEGLYG